MAARRNLILTTYLSGALTTGVLAAFVVVFKSFVAPLLQAIVGTGPHLSLPARLGLGIPVFLVALVLAMTVATFEWKYQGEDKDIARANVMAFVNFLLAVYVVLVAWLAVDAAGALRLANPHG
jgi:hypothetical protein